MNETRLISRSLLLSFWERVVIAGGGGLLQGAMDCEGRAVVDQKERKRYYYATVALSLENFRRKRHMSHEER
jgi:hypothetical protein